MEALDLTEEKNILIQKTWRPYAFNAKQDNMQSAFTKKMTRFPAIARFAL
jgi:hypothetical protein